MLLTNSKPSFSALCDKYGLTKERINEGLDIPHSVYLKFYEYYFDEMPYGIAKARDGDPYNWVCDRIYMEINYAR